MVDPDARRAHHGLDPAERGHPEPMSEGPGGGAPGKRRILVVDVNPLLRRGLVALIDNEPDLAVCAQAATAQEAPDALDATRPRGGHREFSEASIGVSPSEMRATPRCTRLYHAANSSVDHTGRSARSSTS